MPAEPRFAFRPLQLSSAVAPCQGLPQALRSADFSLVAATGLVAPTMALTLAIPLLGSPALASAKQTPTKASISKSSRWLSLVSIFSLPISSRVHSGATSKYNEAVSQFAKDFKEFVAMDLNAGV
jgi:hypothetical protein